MKKKRKKFALLRAINDGREDQAVALITTIADSSDYTLDDLYEIADRVRSEDPELFARIPKVAVENQEISPLARLELTAIFGGSANDVYDRLVEIVENCAPDDDAVDEALAVVAIHSPQAMSLFNQRLPLLLSNQGIG